MAKAPKPGGAQTTDGRTKAARHSMVITLHVGTDTYKVPIQNLPLRIVGEFVSTFGAQPQALAFSPDAATSLKVLWWVGRRMRGERVRNIDTDMDDLYDKVDADPGYLRIEFPKLDDDGVPVEADDSPEA